MGNPYTPRLERQLDGSANQSTDCGRAVTVMLVDFASKGRVRPSTEQIGRRMDRRTGPSNSGNQKQAVESYDNEMRLFYMRPLSYTRKRGADWENATNALDQGAMLSIDVDYSVFNNQYSGKYSCSRSFNGLHSIAIWGRKRINGTVMTRLYDPLADGRYKGCWNGPRWVPLSLIRKATAKVWGRGNYGGGIVRYTKRVPRAEEVALREKFESQKGRVLELAEENAAMREELALGRGDLADLQFALAESRDSIEELKVTLESKFDGLIIDIDGVIEEIENAMPPSDVGEDVEGEDGNDAGPSEA